MLTKMGNVGRGGSKALLSFTTLSICVFFHWTRFSLLMHFCYRSILIPCYWVGKSCLKTFPWCSIHIFSTMYVISFMHKIVLFLYSIHSYSHYLAWIFAVFRKARTNIDILHVYCINWTDFLIYSYNLVRIFTTIVMQHLRLQWN